MIRRIHIQGYKSLRDIQLELQPLTVLFGPNAAGKSNLLDALQILSRIASRTLKEAFEPPNRGKPMESFSFGAGGLQELIGRDSATFSIEVDVELSPAVIAAVNQEIMDSKRGQSLENGASDSHKRLFIHHERLRYRIEIGIRPRSGVLYVADEYLAALGNDGQPKTRPQAFIERKDHRIHLRMEGQSHPTYFERSLDRAIVSRAHYPPHYPHLTALKRELESWFLYYFEPRERMRAPTAVKEVRHVGLMGEDLAAFLHTLGVAHPRQFEAVEKALHHLIPSITGIHTDVNRFGEVELSVAEEGVAMPARVVSEGTLRVLGLLALRGAQHPPALIGFEEPENGVHPRRVRDVAEILHNLAASGTTQVIATTHSPVLLDHVPIPSLFSVRKGPNGTVIRPFSTWGPLGRTPDIDAALADDSGDVELRPSELVLRGDLDA